MKGTTQNLNPEKNIKSKIKEASNIEWLIECQKFRLAIIQKSMRDHLQYNQMMDQSNQQLLKQIDFVKAENENYFNTIQKNASYFKGMSNQRNIENQLCQTLLPRFQTMQKNLVCSQQLNKYDQELNRTLNQLNYKVEEQQKFNRQADGILIQTQTELRRLKDQDEWQNKEINRVYNLLSNCEIQSQEMFILRKKLNNDLQEAKGNIRVYCRIRPSKKGESAISITSQNSLNITYQKERNKSYPEKFQHGYVFQQIFDENQTQQIIFTGLSQLIQSSIDGKNVCIFAYGQTGSGKTYTLLGLSENLQDKTRAFQQRGLVQRSIELIFKQIQISRKFKWVYKAYLSIQEIYLENMIDLLGKETNPKDKCVEIEVNQVEQILAYLMKSSQNRKVAATNMNQRSSRSHLIITIRLVGQSEKNEEKRTGSLVFVDLAGSQRLKQSKVEGQNLKQTQFINKSLSALGTVINEMRKNSEHISFRNSKLTHILQKYLQGQSKTLMFVNVSPDPEDIPQTKLSLGFAEGVRQVKMNK